MITELRESLARQADQVIPARDPYGRLVQRHEQRRRRMTTAVAALVILVALNGGWLLTKDWQRSSGGAAGAPSTLVQALLDSPTRGSLAENAAFLERIRQRAAQEVNGSRGSAPKGPRMPADPAQIRVLFAGDVPGGQRLVLVGGVSGWPVTATFSADTGTAADALRLSGSGELEPIVRSEWRTESGDDGYTLVLGPAGAHVELSGRARYLADGTVSRTWTEQPTGYLLRSPKDLPAGSRVRFMFNGSVLYEGQTFGRSMQEGSVTVDPAPLYGRGKAIPVAAQDAAATLSRVTGLTSKDAHFQVLWSDEVPMPGLTRSTAAAIVTVQAMTADGGGPYVTYAYDSTGPDALVREHPTGDGVLGAPDRALIVMRLPYFEVQKDTVQLVAPPGAVHAELVRDGKVAATADLTKGVGQLDLPPTGAARVTVRVYDAAGTRVAERDFTDYEGNPTGVGLEPEVRGW